MTFISKSSKIIIFAEARWYVFKNAEGLAKKSKKGKLKDLNMGKLPPKEGVLLQHYLRSLVQARIHEATNARMNHVDPQEYGLMMICGWTTLTSQCPLKNDHKRQQICQIRYEKF